MDEKTTSAVLYGTLATLLVSLLSLGGAFIVPLLRGQQKHRWMHFFVAMAVATLSSDAILHIIPEILGTHSHGHGETGLDHSHGHSHDHGASHEHGNYSHEHGSDSHEHGNDSHEHESESHHRHRRHTRGEHDAEDAMLSWFAMTDERRSMCYLSVILLAIYALYFIEFVIYYRKRTVKCPDAISPELGKSGSRLYACEQTMTNHAWEEEKDCPEHNNNKRNSENNSISTQNSCSNFSTSPLTTETSNEESPIICCGLKSRALVILLGDGIHNLVDGVAIGISFLNSDQLGIITTIAVICHELPHELGDLAVLLDSGMSMCKALILNFISALTAFIGLYVAIWLGSNEVIEKWLLAITAGMFLYVAWIDMLAHLKHDGVHKDHWFIACALQYAGFTVGFLTIFLLGWFEDQLFHSH